ncbi:MAG: bacteriohopanetetrol glucosamine biosynthesis glycosyltransferase HpnI [Acidobacteria bacterium]|nr:bacteriohopanetetrol glucosamine biosynthesis glycosyltransferase HpnI [Acidobacteriota bacterium]
MTENIVLLCALAGLTASCVYLGLVLIAIFRFDSSKPKAGGATQTAVSLPPVTVLKPLHGIEPLLEQSLDGFFRQVYRTYELIFGARTADDPALQVVDSLRKKYPQVRAHVVLSGEPNYPNAKVFVLEKMVAAAAHQTIVITDSDVQVTTDYLEKVVSPLLKPNVGLVTCLYRGVPTGGIWSRLEALGMSVEMSSGVLVANLVEGMKFALGPTMATRKEIVDDLGGFGALGDYCADDFVLGNLTANAGKKVVLSHHIIDHVVLNRSARESFLHQVRWMKSARFSRRLGHIGTGLTFAMPFGLLGLAAGWMRGDWKLGLGLLGLALVNRLVLAVSVGWGIVRDRRSVWFCWLYPLRDILGFFMWCASFIGNVIVWRGEEYRLMDGGKMVRKIASPQPAPTT